MLQAEKESKILRVASLLSLQLALYLSLKDSHMLCSCFHFIGEGGHSGEQAGGEGFGLPARRRQRQREHAQQSQPRTAQEQW